MSYTPTDKFLPADDNRAPTMLAYVFLAWVVGFVCGCVVLASIAF